MAVSGKAIKQRIKSVKNTKKMTKAMELVSAAKMRKAVQGTLNTRMYATMARQLLQQLSTGAELKSPLLEERPTDKMLVILVSSNRSLCGSFNSNIFKKAGILLANIASAGRHRTRSGKIIAPSTEITIDVLGVGKKSSWFAKKFAYPLIAAFDHLSEKPSFEDVLPISSIALKDFVNKKYDKVVLIYTEYKSSLTQEVKMRQLLPVSPQDLEKMLSEIVVDEDEVEGIDADKYLFEPNKDLIMQTILPRLVEIQVYQAMLESSASEHSARMVAMKSASEAAGEMIDVLTLEFNKARQAAITQEISEIAGGAVALG